MPTDTGFIRLAIGRFAVAAFATFLLATVMPTAQVLADAPTFPAQGAVATGANHTCALANNGTVWCWGIDQYGQLGDGSAGPGTRTTAQPVIGLSRATAVVAGQEHTCALLANGTAECWGHNDQHQLGDGTNRAMSTTPVSVVGLTDAVALSAHADHTCALVDDGTIKCWGDDQGGGLLPDAIGPVGATTVSGMNNVVQVSAGINNDCALLQGGTVKCWGTNKYGQLGDGSKTSSASPVTVAGLGEAQAIAAGRVFTCAVVTDGTAWCWGKNNNSILGSATLSQSLTPIQIGGVANAVTLAATDAACALISDQTLRCWGKGTEGEMGDGQHHDDAVPSTAGGLDTTRAVDVGAKHVCAAREDGSVWCWGDYSDGAVGTNAGNYVTSPVQSAGFDAGSATPAIDEIDGAHAITTLPFQDSVDPSTLSAAAGDPTPSCGPATISATAWYTYQSDFDRSIELSTPTDGTAVAAYEQSGSDLTELACATSSAAAPVDISAGQKIFVLVASDGTSSPMSLQLTGPPAPANDDFADATAIASLPFTDTIDTTSATRQAGEPRPTCAPSSPPYNSAWYRYDAVSDGAITIQADGYPLRVGAYTGPDLADLHQVACLDGSGADSQLTVASGKTYYLQIFGVGGSGKLSVAVDAAAPTDTDKPVIDSAPKATPLAGAVLSAAKTKIEWAGHDAGSGIDHYELQRKNGTGAWTTIATTDATNFTVTEKLGVTHTFRVRAVDVAGNIGDWSVGPAYTPTLKQSTWKKVAYSGAWSTDTISGASGTGVRKTVQQGATATFTFTGRAFQIVSIKGTGRGVMRVSVDGNNTTVDLSASNTTLQWIAFAKSFAASGTHTIVIRNQGTARIDLDALVLYK